MRFYKKTFTASWFAYVVISFLFVLVNLGWYIPISRTLNGKIIAEEQNASEKAGIAASTFLEMRKLNLEVIARALSDDLSEARNLGLVTGLLSEKDFNRIFLSDYSGSELFVADRARTVFPKEYGTVRATDEFTRAVSGQAAFGRVRITERFEPVLTVAVPIVSSTGKIIGVLGAEISAKSVFESIGSVTISGRGSAYVTDETGVLIAHKDVSLVLKNANFLNRLVVSETLKNGADVSKKGTFDGIYVYDNEEGVSARGAGTYVESTRWAVIFEDPKNQAEQLLFFIRILLAIVFAVGLLSIFILWKINANLRRARTIIERERNQFSVILASLGEGLFVIDSGGSVILSNKAANRMAGREESEILGKSIDDIFPLFKNGAPLPKSECPFPIVMKTGNPIVNTLSDGISFRRKDGIDVPITINITQLRYEQSFGNATNGIIAIFHDATVERRTQTELQESIEETQKLNFFMIGREVKMTELKEKIALLEKENGEKIG